MTDKILRADSTQITGIKSCVFKEQRNTENNLRFGACAASSIEFEVYGAQSSAPAVGEVLTYYQTDSNGVDTLIGKFIAQPSIPGRNTFKVLAYDNIILLETDFSEHLATIQTNFPMALSALLTEVASVAGVTFGNSPTLASTSIAEFSASGVSCRQVVAWAAEMSGQYVYADTSGDICFGWYSTNSAYKIYPTSGSSGGVTYVPYKQGGLDYKDFAVATVDCVAVKPPEEEDVAYIYPLNGSGNTYTVTDNLLLSGASSAVMSTVASTLYTVLTGLSAYRPMTAHVFRGENPLRAGDIVAVQDAQGVTFNTIVMSVTVAMDGTTLECTGAQTYDADNGSGVRQQLVNLASNIVRINNLKVDWADINTAIINYLTANNVTAQNLTIVDENGNVLATFDSSGIVLGDTDGVHAEIDFNSFELIDQSGNTYFSVGDLRNSSGIATVSERFVGDGSTTQFLLTPTANSTASMTVTVDGTVMSSGVTKSVSYITFDTAPDGGSTIVVSYTTTSAAYHYDLGIRSSGTNTGFSSSIAGRNLSAEGVYSFAGGGNGNNADGNYSAVVGGRNNSALDSESFAIGGRNNNAQGVRAGVVGGENNLASNTNAIIVGGVGNNASAQNSTVIGGTGVITGDTEQVAFGRYNVQSPNKAEVVGGGTGDLARANIRTLDWSGNETLAGNLFLNGGSVNVAKGLNRVSETYSSTFSYAAGTIGTRAIADLIDCSKTGYTIESFSIFGATGTPNFMPILVKQNGTQSIYVLCYRASATAVSDGNVTFQVNYIKT